MDQKNAVRALAALSHDNRLSVFRLLVTAGPTGIVAGEIATRLNITSTALSFHLKELDRAGLIQATREGRFKRYAINVEGMRALLAFLTNDCCAGMPELCGQEKSNFGDALCPASHVEKV